MAEDTTSTTAGRLRGRRVVVTGAGRGIGRAIVEAFAAEGAAVVAAARTVTEIESVCARQVAAGRRVAAIPVDVTDGDSVRALAARAADALGGHADVVVNNAGIYRARPFGAYSIDDWTEVFDVNVHGTVRVTQAFLPAMVAARWGRVINVASTAGKSGSPNQSAYSASKHAVVGLTRCLALEVAAHGVCVNALCPGWVDTDLLRDEGLAGHLGVEVDRVVEVLSARSPIGRMLRPEDVAELAVYLASPASGGMTGVGLTLAAGALSI